MTERKPRTKDEIKNEDGTFSKLLVMHSAAGYYVGRMYTDDTGFTEPGTRESHYFRTMPEAERALNGDYYREYDSDDLLLLYGEMTIAELSAAFDEDEDEEDEEDDIELVEEDEDGIELDEEDEDDFDDDFDEEDDDDE